MQATVLRSWLENIIKLFRTSIALHTSIRALIIVAAALRYFTDAPNNPNKFYWLSILITFCIYALIVGKISNDPRFSNRIFRSWLPVVGDTIFVSLFYWQTHKLLSDMYLFFYLPILVAADKVGRKEQIPAFIFIGTIFSSTMLGIYLFGNDVPVSSNVFLRTFTPRLVIFLMVLLVSLIRSHALKEQTEIMSAAYTTAVKVAEGQDLQTRLEKIMDSAVHITDAQGCEVYLKLPKRNFLELVATRGIDSNILPVGFRVGINQGMAGVVFSSKKPIIVNDYSTYDRRIPHLADVFKAVISVPLVFAQKPIGVISVLDYRKQRTFSIEDREKLMSLAPYVSNAIHDIQVLEETKLQATALSLLNQAGQEMNANLKTGRAFTMAAKYAWRLSNLYHDTESTFSCIWMLDKGRALLSVVAAYPEKYLPEIRKQLGPIDLRKNPIGIIGRSIRDSRVVLANNVNYEHEYIRFHADTQSQLAVPIMEEGDKAFGVISVEHVERGAFSESLKSNMEILSNQIFAGIRNAKLLEDQRKLHSQTIALYNTTSSIDLTHGVKSTADSILTELRKWLPYTRATLQVIRNGERQIIATNNMQPEQIDKNLVRPVEQDKLIASIIKSRRIYYLTSTSTHPGWKRFPTTADIRTWICIPLYVTTECIGLMTLDFIEEYDAPDELRILLPIFANESASILNNAILYNENIEKVDQLTDTKDHLSLVLDFLTENQNLINIGLVYGEDIHYAKSRLGYAKSMASDIARNRFGKASDEIIVAAEEIKKGIDKYLKALNETQRQVVEPPTLISLDLHDLLQKTVQSKWQSWWNAGIDPDLHLDAKNPIIKAPENQLKQVFLVILQNGIDAIQGKHGKIVISTEDYLMRKKEFIKVHFMDNGNGIPPHIAKDLFTIKVNSSKPGHSGMGLLWARSIMRSYRGDISFVTEVRKGTTFTVLVPRDFDKPMFFSRLPYTEIEESS